MNDIHKHQIPSEIMDGLKFDVIWEMKPITHGKVSHNKGMISAHRFYQSYGKVPPMDPQAFSYMFAGVEEPKFNPIPDEFLSLMEYLNKTLDGPDYNQLVVNWYEEDTDYCPIHRDCLDNMSDGATVSIVNILESEDLASRELVFRPGNYKPLIKIPCNNGLCVTFGGVALTEWRHGVPEAKEPAARRISLSFRSYL